MFHKPEREIGDGAADLAAGDVAVGDGDDRLVGDIEVVQDNLGIGAHCLAEELDEGDVLLYAVGIVR